MSSFKEVPMIITDLMSQHAKTTPDKTALIFEEQRHSWKELNQRINKVANTLIERGIKKGDKVAVFMSNMSQNVEIMFGIIKSGAVLVPIATMIEADTLLHMLQNSDSRMVFFSNDNTELINRIKEDLMFHNNNFVEVGTVGLGSYEQLIECSSYEEPRVDLQFDDDCVIMYSSGTTGVPKGILHTHYSRSMFAVKSAMYSLIDRNAITLLTTPFYTNSTWSPMLPTLVSGGTIIGMKKFSSKEFFKISHQEKPSHSLMVPTQYYMVLNDPDFDLWDVSSYEQLMSVSAPLHKKMKLEIVEKFSCDFSELYGLTEGIGTLLYPQDVLKKPDSVGLPNYGGDIRIIDEKGNELPRGEVGEIVGRGSTLMKGYYKLPDKTKEVIWVNRENKQYLKTGDMGKLDKDGFLYILGRQKDMIISGGLNIYAADIENVLATHPNVSDCAVIGIPNEKWGETPLALVELESGTTIPETELKSWLNERLNKYQRVSSVEVVESFPRNALGKVLKRELRRMNDPLLN